MSKLTGKVALITGGSKGIGAALAIRLAELGANVAINFSSGSQAANEVVEKINTMTKGLAIQANAATVDGVEHMVKATVDHFGKIDILVPMAGVMMMKDLAHTAEEDFDKSYALNVKGPYFLAQKAVPHMPPKSSIVLISTSVCALSGVQPGYLLYASTKGAVEQMTRVLAKDLGTKDINVNCVAPGPTGTALFFEGKSEAMVKGIANLNPHGRIGTPEEVAEAIGLLCGDESRWVTGQILRVNGGMA